VSAGAGFDVPSQTSADTGGGVASADTGGGDTSALGTTSVGGDTSGLSSTGVPASAGTGTRSSGGGAAQDIGGVNIAKTFGGVGAGWLLAALVGAVLIGFGASRLIADLVDQPPASCPLEVRR
jgi:hypothetical protein